MEVEDEAMWVWGPEPSPDEVLGVGGGRLQGGRVLALEGQAVGPPACAGAVVAWRAGSLCCLSPDLPHVPRLLGIFRGVGFI